ncbi:MAG TPA: Stp1/IreP family PP2C-type Ser/Thr phosphatase, partial [Actinomycetota bacterium]|nr:Stp1/IreP family PP2C-type Ser/Thr phosphatase [Actinomycetota bacterium]
MKLSVGAQSDVGRVRERNEDALLLHDPLYAVADGMGGHRAGEIAARTAVDTLRGEPLGDGAHALAERVRQANRAVLDTAAGDRALEGMGTTLTAVLLAGDELRIAHVGDSRAYLLRGDAFTQITEDHTLVQRMVRQGRLTPAEAEVHPQRSILTQALGVDPAIEVDELSVPVLPGDRVLLCTDGLTGMLSQEEIEGTLRETPDPQAAADALVAAAVDAGGIDNVTVLVIDLLDDSGGRPALPPAPEEADEAEEAEEAEPEGETGDEPDDTASVERVARPARAPARPRRWRRAVVAAAAVALLVTGAVAAKALYVDRQWYVGESNGMVAIFRGLPAEPLGLDLSTLVEETGLPAAEVERL